MLARDDAGRDALHRLTWHAVKVPGRFVLRLVLAGVLLALVLSAADLSQMTVRLDARLAAGAALAIALLVVAQGISALRWARILGPGSPGWLYMWRLYAVSAFFSLFLPTTIGGDAVRVVALARHQGRSGSVVASVLLDRAFGVAALVIYLVAGAIVAPELLAPIRAAAHWKGSVASGVAVVGALSIGAGLVSVLVRRSAKLRGVLREGIALLSGFRHRSADFIAAFALGLVVQAAYIAAWMALAAGLRFTLPLELFLLAVPLVSLATMLPVTFAGIGVREGALVLLLRGSGTATADVVAFSLLFFGCGLVVGACGGIVFALRGTAPPTARSEEGT
jgi:uncharacterized membrane protein YbhN (UPF0104 family)